MMRNEFVNVFLSASDSLSEGTSAGEIGENAFRLAIQYGWYILLIVAGLLLLAFVKRKSRKNLTPSAVRQSCLTLKKKLEVVLDERDKSRNGLFNRQKWQNSVPWPKRQCGMRCGSSTNEKTWFSKVWQTDSTRSRIFCRSSRTMRSPMRKKLNGMFGRLSKKLKKLSGR